MGSPQKLPIFDLGIWRVGRVVRQEPAKLRTGVRFPHAPPVILLDGKGLAPKILSVCTESGIHSLKRKMINTQSLKLSALAFFLATLLGACASSGDSPTGTPQEVQEVQQQLLGDMPLPAASKIIGADSLIIGRGDNWVGRVVLSGVQTPTDIYAFFQSEYPRAGWTTVSAVKTKTSILVFTKGDRTATVELNEGSLTGPKTLITITSSPKNANVVAPSKK
jgi:hypothetical protein